MLNQVRHGSSTMQVTPVKQYIPLSPDVYAFTRAQYRSSNACFLDRIVKTKMACCRTRTRERIYFAFSGQAHRLLFHEQCHHLKTKDNRTKKQLDEAVCGLVLGRDRTDSHPLPAIVFQTVFSSIFD